MANNRLKYAYLVDSTHKLPMPGAGGRFFSAEGETIDMSNPFWIMCVKDCSVRLGEPPAQSAPVEKPVAKN